MPSYRESLPQLAGSPFLTDGGLETTLIFHDHLDLPCFAAFPLVDAPRGRETLKTYFRPYLEKAAAHGVGFVLSTPTWRANADWGARVGYSAQELRRVNSESVALVEELRPAYACDRTPIVIEGVLGPRGDGYKVEGRMTAAEAERYHADQIEAFRDSAADMIGAFTITYPEEAIGIARAAARNGLPAAIAFTVETDGRLPSGDTLRSAIEQVDQACEDDAPVYYMINCAHPTHFDHVLVNGEVWLDRIRGLRANASTMSHAELDNAQELDAGDPVDLGRRYRDLRERMPRLSVLGGCCGTDHRHIAAICDACL
jgi:homocysteine S-methyltransferase